MQRRQLEFREIGQVIADVDRLRAGGYHRVGNWNLAQVCNHLSIFVRGSLEGFDFKAPWPIRLVAPLILWYMRRVRRMPEGVRVPSSVLPSADADESQEVAGFRQLFLRFREYPGALAPSPLFGRLSHEQWTDLHLIHAAHHLSFLLPK